MMSLCRTPSHRQIGLTLLESLFCVTLSLTLLTLTGVAFTRPVQSARRHARINELVASLHLARNQAILRSTVVVMCTSPDGRECVNQAHWHPGWLIFADPDNNQSCRSTDGFLCEDGGEILMYRPPADEAHGAIIANRENMPIRFAVNGFTEGSNRSFAVCSPRPEAPDEQIVLSRTGRVRRETAKSSALCR